MKNALEKAHHYGVLWSVATLLMLYAAPAYYLYSDEGGVFLKTLPVAIVAVWMIATFSLGYSAGYAFTLRNYLKEEERLERYLASQPEALNSKMEAASRSVIQEALKSRASGVKFWSDLIVELQSKGLDRFQEKHPDVVKLFKKGVEDTPSYEVVATGLEANFKKSQSDFYVFCDMMVLWHRHNFGIWHMVQRDWKYWAEYELEG
jgi:hypothetical protein